MGVGVVMTVNDKNNDRAWALTDRAMAPRQRVFARRMRKAPTEAERKCGGICVIVCLWLARTFVGKYRLDLTSPILPVTELRLIIEIDGSQHGSQVTKDEARTARLESDGYRVLRFWNNEVLSNIEGVLAEIQNAIATTPTPDPSPQGGGEQRSPSGEGEE